MYTPYKYFRGLDTSKLVVMKLEEMNNFKNEKNVAKINLRQINWFEKKFHDKEINISSKI